MPEIVQNLLVQVTVVAAAGLLGYIVLIARLDERVKTVQADLLTLRAGVQGDVAELKQAFDVDISSLQDGLTSRIDERGEKLAVDVSNLAYRLDATTNSLREQIESNQERAGSDVRDIIDRISGVEVRLVDRIGRLEGHLETIHKAIG